MSDHNRYHLWAALECHAFSKAEAVLRFSAEEDGMWVQWQDYANLKAEVERLDTLCKQLMTQHSDISCENIMLRKAGDAMADWMDELGSPRAVPFFQAWNAAKEGKPSV